MAAALFPILTAPPTSGIAALAASAEPLDQRNAVVYQALAARSILNRCASRRVPFDWTLNPYRGCEFGCHYCYARYTHEFMELRGADDFERRIFAKQRAAELLRRDLGKVAPGDWIALGTATDPYQPAERHYRITRSLLEVFAERRGLRLGIITKSALIERDVNLLTQIADRHHLVVRLTLTTCDAALARVLEPRAPRPDLRLKALAALRAAGISAGVMCSPVLPGITDSVASLDAVAAAAAAAGAQFFSASALFLQPAARARLLPLLRERFPHLLPAYQRAFDHSAYLGAAYRHRLSDRVAAIRMRHHLASNSSSESTITGPKTATTNAQLPLFGGTIPLASCGPTH